MVYEKDGYRLYKRPVKLRGGHEQTIYFFSKRVPLSAEPSDLPRGYRVGVNAKTGLPFLKKE
ncbi:MAG: hypothetical protein KY455_13980 [Euryarchaeota archaeon]|nr:hypothetical protein [Euryarchaeota archaeon]